VVVVSPGVRSEQAERSDQRRRPHIACVRRVPAQQLQDGQHAQATQVAQAQLRDLRVRPLVRNDPSPHLCDGWMNGWMVVAAMMAMARASDE
jgi:hypothetical protein